ncbi:MAG: DNA processing protein [Paraglaciecola sp.]|jgi:DNA processing protein
MLHTGSNAQHEPSEHELVQWLTLEQVPRFSIKKLTAVLDTNGLQFADLFCASHSQLQAWGLSAIQSQVLRTPNLQFIENSLQWLAVDDGHFILPVDNACYSTRLLEIALPPLLLYCHGNIKLLKSRQIAMVGSRNPSISGKQNAQHFAQALVNSGWTVTSGLALGIDGLSHYGALAANGNTIAVLGSGIDYIYPRRHIQLSHSIVDKEGLIVSEFAPGMGVRAENFPRRNRIISGLAYGTLVIEAALKSGSLITARYAIEQDREVFAVPGNINNPLSRGCHYLLKQGAKLVETLDDINDEFQHLNFNTGEKDHPEAKKNRIQSLAEDKLLDSVDFETTPLDIVAQRCSMPVAQVMSLLLEYELRGLVTAVPGGYLKLGEK